jgi:YfiH family protein
MHFYNFKHLQQWENLRHGVTQKDPTLGHLGSLALHTGEEPKEIIHNRHHVATALNLDDTWHFVVANQTHSSNVTVINEAKTKGWQHSEDSIENTDAMVTNLTHTMLTVLTADCVPILLFDPIQNAIGVVHAGWRGTQANIVAKTIQTMQKEFDSNTKDIMVGVGPSIGKCCYEVGEEVATHFKEYKSAIVQEGSKYKIDLPKINQIQLIDAGVKKEQITLSHICTSCEVEKFFSYRKEQGCSGRFMSLIGLQ